MTEDKLFSKAREFASQYSNDISVDDSHRESAFADGKEFACVPLSFPAKGNKRLMEELLQSGFCTKMQGAAIGGKRICRVLLWIDPETYEFHKVN